MAIVRAGTIDGSERLSPALHIFTSTKQPWLVLPEGVPAFEDVGTPEELMAILAGPYSPPS
jgi:hypothetical protein